jgi:hypothetical protein
VVEAAEQAEIVEVRASTVDPALVVDHDGNDLRLAGDSQRIGD